MKFFKNLETDTITPFILGTGAVLIILSFIIPFPAILFIQDALFFSYDNLTFIRPKSAYLGFALGLVWIALIMFSFLLTKMYTEKRKTDYKLTALHIILFLASFIIFAFSIFNYHYIDHKGVHSNPFWTFTEKSINWDDVEHVSRKVRESNYQVLSYTFKSANKQITIPYDTQDIDTSRTVYGVIGEYGWEVEDVFVEE